MMDMLPPAAPAIVAGDPIGFFSIQKHGLQEVLRILPDGRVVLAPGFTSDQASVAFWRGMEELAPGICQQVLDERKAKRKEE